MLIGRQAKFAPSSSLFAGPGGVGLNWQLFDVEAGTRLTPSGASQRQKTMARRGASISQSLESASGC